MANVHGLPLDPADYGEYANFEEAATAMVENMAEPWPWNQWQKAMSALMEIYREAQDGAGGTQKYLAQLRKRLMIDKLPQEAKPNKHEAKRGQKSWTRESKNGARIEVNMNHSAFWISKMAHDEEGLIRNVQWGTDIHAAWDVAKKRAKWDEPKPIV